MQQAFLELKKIYKSFPGVKALKGVDFHLNKGEIVSLIGTNGAGKSTLCSIVAGIYPHDAGEITLDGKSVKITSPKVAESLGIGIVHQEPTLVPQLTIVKNMFLGKELTKTNLILDFERMEKESRETIESLGFHLDIKRMVSSLTLVEREVVEIAKAMLLKPKILILDEVTAPLNFKEVEHLFAVIKDLKKQDLAIIFISHKIRETLQISDRVVVFRDGLNAAELEVTSELTERDIISPMLGETVNSDIECVIDNYVEDDNKDALMDIKGLTREGIYKNISFTLHKGEIIGFAGLKGAGITEIFSSIQGIMSFNSGNISINGQPTGFKSPKDGINAGVGMVTNDRQKEGLALMLPVKDNIVISSLKMLKNKFNLMNKKKLNEAAIEFTEKLNIKTPTINQIAQNLSGGNQQKLVLAKWLLRNLNILLIDEPTRGVDVKAKSEIYKLLIKQKESGKGILVYSPETRELLNICDRILVAVNGQIIHEVKRTSGDFNEQHILEVIHSALV
ncbi:MAG: sugar ABC transporter ATP-binding protein [Ruminiclostridium sp.]